MKVSYKDLIISPKDSRAFTISGATDAITPRYFNEEIVSLESNNLTASVGQVFPVGKRKYKINTITRKLVGSKLLYELSTGALNKSAMFVFPMFDGDKSLYMYDSLFVNCFLHTSKHQNCISLLYRFSGDTTFLKFEAALAKFGGFIDSYDPSPEYVLFTFEVPSQYKHDYTRFCRGEYSKFSPEYKEKILEFHEFSRGGELDQIMHKSKERRERLEAHLGTKLPLDAELYSVLDVESETFNPNDYI